ncbi:hypothetical protein FRB96_009501 [Tulasnella sp. 330]|nr:hypothetical protein FRB96_009501 [Tulasnella sp. 330]
MGRETIRSITDRAVTRLLEETSPEINDLAAINVATLTGMKMMEAEIKYLETYAKVVNQHLANRRRDFNSLQPVSRLPEEILVYVIGIAMERHATKRYIRDLHRLTCVSFRWSAIITDAPTLWGVVLAGFSRGDQAMALKKSNETPLEVGCHAAELIGNNVDFIHRVTSHQHRWHSAFLSVDRSDRLEPLCRSSAPILRTLTIRVNPQSSSSARQTAPMNLFGGMTPRLRYLKLERFWIPWDSRLLSGLETLHLINTKRDGPSFTQLADSLQSCPNLITLRIKQVQLATVESRDVKPIELPHMTSCTIVGLDSQATITLLASIRAPICSHLVVDWKGNAVDELGVALVGWRPCIRSILAKSTQVDVGISLYSPLEGLLLYLRSSSGTLPALDIEFKAQESITALVALVSQVSQSVALVPANINVHWLNPQIKVPHDILLIFAEFPILVGVQLWCEGLATSFVKCMSYPSELDEPPTWPFPRITSLDLRDSSLSTELILQMVRARYGSGERMENRIPLMTDSPPAPLQRLVATTITDLDVAALKEINVWFPNCTIECRPMR